METKYKKTTLPRMDKYVETQEYFGWEVVDQMPQRSDFSIILTLQRDGSRFTDFRKVRSLEKQYNRIARPIPLTFLIFVTLGVGFLITFFVTKNMLFYAYGFLYPALTCFCIATFALIVYILILSRRKKLLATLLQQASIATGTNKEWPTGHNINPDTETTWALSRLTNRQ